MSLRTTLITSAVALTIGGCNKKAETPAAPTPVAAEPAAPAEAEAAKPAEPEAAKPAEAEAAKTAEPTEPEAAPMPTGPAALWQTEGFSTPESVLVAGDVYYVSNINGAPTDKDDNGVISKLGPDGKIIELKWISGENPNFELNAPKGMAILDGNLYVADIDRVMVFSAETGVLVATHIITGATFLNDVFATDSTIYVSDTAVGADFKPLGNPDVWALQPKAEGAGWTRLGLEAPGLPNGVFAMAGEGGDTVYYNGFDDKKLIAGYNRATSTALAPIALPAGSLDGLFADKNEDGSLRFFFSSWESGAVYQSGKDGFAIVGAGMKGPADFGVDIARGAVIVPVFQENRVDAYAILK